MLIKFIVKDENNVERDATLITVVENENKKYVVYSIDRDSDNVNVFVSRLEKNSEGKNIIVDINDESEKNRLNQIVREIIELPLVGGE